MRKPACEQAIDSEDAPGHLTGFTRRIAAALAHLSDAWSVADHTNTAGVVAAIRSLFLTRSVMENREAFEYYLIWDLGEDTARRLLFEVYDGLPDESLLSEDCTSCGERKRLCCDTGGEPICIDCCDVPEHRR